MTDLTQADREALIAAIPTIEKHSGLKWYEWCCLEHVTIHDPDPERPNNLDGFAECPPAVAAAVVAWAGINTDFSVNIACNKTYDHCVGETTRTVVYGFTVRDIHRNILASGEYDCPTESHLQCAEAVVECLKGGE